MPGDGSLSAASNVAIEFRGVSVQRDGRTTLANVSLRVGRGETLVLLGRSGSGKTTALKLINRLLLPSSGEVLVEGKSTAAWDAIRLRRSIGYGIQEVGLLPHYTVEQNIALLPQLESWPAERVAARVRALLELVRMPPADFLHRYPDQLSGGQRQRVGLARALAIDPRILLFDEPFGALDPVTRAELQAELQRLRAALSKTIVFVTHDVAEALLLADHIALLDSGRLEGIFRPREFLASSHDSVRPYLEALRVTQAWQM
jgi:osmoprotectant transport system ATP-binding protein